MIYHDEKFYKTHKLSFQNGSPEKHLASYHLTQVLLAQGLICKNLYNTVLYLVKNTQSIYLYDKETKQYFSKPLLHANQKLVLDFVNKAVSHYNAKRLFSKDDKRCKEEPFAAFNDFKSVITAETYSQMLDHTFLQYCAEHYSKLQASKQYLDYSDYEACSGTTRQQVVKDVISSHINYYSSVKDYNLNPAKYTGYPKKPDYMDKNSRRSIAIPFSLLSKSGHLTKIKKNRGAPQ